MEEKDSREGCQRAKWTLLHWMRSRAQTAHCTTLFIFKKVEVLGFSPALMEVGRYVTVKVWICLRAYVCAYVGTLYIWVEGGRRKRKWAQPCYPSLPCRHKLPCRHRKTKLPICSSLPVCTLQTVMSPLFWNCEMLLETPECSVFCLP